MSDRSAIEWTYGTWNPARGGTKVSPTRKQCALDYAKAYAGK